MKERAFSLREIAERLQHVCHAKETGTAYIITSDNASVKIVIQAGEIVAINFRNKMNQEAIPLLASIQQGRYTFLKDLADMKGLSTTLDTQAILGQWLNDTVSDPLSSRPVAPPSRSTKPAFVPPSNTSNTSESSLLPPKPFTATNGQFAAIMGLIEQELVKFVGPCATIICQDYFEQLEKANQSPDLNIILEQVSVDIDDPAKRLKFKQTIKLELKQQGIL